MDPVLPLRLVRRFAGGLRRRGALGLRNWIRNRAWGLAPVRFLVVRHTEQPEAYDVFLRWVEANHPELRPLFELGQLTGRTRVGPAHVLLIPWLNDPVQRWSPSAYEDAARLTERARAAGVPSVNPVDRLTNAGKSAGATVFRELGARAPRMERIFDVDRFKADRFGLDFPLIVREDWGHNLPIHRADAPQDLEAIPYDAVARPVAVEFIDVRDPRDGLYRKYRYLAVGRTGISLSLHVTRSWITYGTGCEDARELLEEERAFVEAPGPNPHHELFQQARERMGLDLLAFDYGYDHDGRLVIWEANPFPFLHFPNPAGKRTHRARGVDRAMAAMLGLYLEAGGLEVPDRLRRRIAADGP